MKTKKLKYTPDFDFELLGISSSENDYKISWLISTALKIDFARSAELIIREPKIMEEQVFSVFESQTDYESFNLKLVSNKGNIGYLIPEHKNIDYFLIILNSNEKNITNKLQKKLREIENISAVFKLEPTSLKSKEKLLF